MLGNNISLARKNMSNQGQLASAVCWILTDGKIGMENQGLAVAEAVGLPIIMKRARRTGLWRHLPTHWQVHAPPEQLLRQLSRASDTLMPPWPRLLISIGRNSVPLALSIRRLARGATFALHIQNPKVPPNLFDLVAAPSHDGMDPARVLVTLGAPHRVTADRLAAEAPAYAGLIQHLPHPRLAVLLGGNSKGFRFDARTASQLAQTLTGWAGNTAGSLLITPSRRTPQDALTVLKSELAAIPHYFWEGKTANPYFAFLALADAILATSDSVNMVTEAAGTGKPVYIYHLPGHSARIAAFHRAMEQHGATRRFAGSMDSWSYPAVNDTHLIAGAVRRALCLETAEP